MFFSPPKLTLRYTNLVRGLSLLPLGVGVLVVLAVYPDQKSPQDLTWLLVPGLLAALSVFLWLYLGREKVCLHDEGIARTGMFGSKEIPWSDLTGTCYSQTSTAQAVGVHFGILGMAIAHFASKKNGASKANQMLRIVAGDGRKIDVSSSFKGCKDVILAVLGKIHGPMVEQMGKRLDQGEALVFGKIALKPEGLAWKDKAPIPYASIEKIYLQSQILRVKTAGKWLDAVSVPSIKVPNLFVLLDLVERKRTGTVAAPPSYLAII